MNTPLRRGVLFAWKLRMWVRHHCLRRRPNEPPGFRRTEEGTLGFNVTNDGSYKTSSSSDIYDYGLSPVSYCTSFAHFAHLSSAKRSSLLWPFLSLFFAVLSREDVNKRAARFGNLSTFSKIKAVRLSKFLPAFGQAGSNFEPVQVDQVLPCIIDEQVQNN